jgi:hypothetical protein
LLGGGVNVNVIFDFFNKTRVLKVKRKPLKIQNDTLLTS